MVFAFGLRHEDSSLSSFVDIGFYSDDAMDDPSDLVWIDIYDHYYVRDLWWQAVITGIRLRPQAINGMTYEESVKNAEREVAIVNREVLGILDTGSSCLVLSYYEYLYVMDRLLEKLTYYEVDYYYGWGYLFYCDDIERLPTMDLLIGGHWFEVSVDDYVVNFGSGTCAFCIQNSYYSWLAILGDALMRDYYIVHDQDNMRFGVAPLA